MVSHHALSAFFRDESGQDIIEYALLAAFLGLGTVAAYRNLASGVKNVFEGVGTVLTNAS